MKLLDKLDCAEQLGGGAGAHQSKTKDSWRPPRHPDMPNFEALWNQVGPVPAGRDSARSDGMSTLSGGDWPDELRL